MRTFAILTIFMLGSVATLLPQPDHQTRFLTGVSYAPSHNSSGSPDTYVTEDRIRADMTLLSKITGRVRTYTIANGMDRVPAVARALDMKVAMGIWLGPDRTANRTQIEKAIVILRANTDTIDRVFVGNETLLRGDLTLAELREYLRMVKDGIAGAPIEVTTGETWGFWLNNPELAQDCDIIGAHILPYWDGYPVDDAGKDIQDQLAALRAAFPDKPIVIAETGWPSRGQTRQAALPSPSNQQLFLENFLQSDAAHDVEYYLVEGFDQPWKVSFEGEVGGGWGLFDISGAPKFDFWSGPAGVKTRKPRAI